jgi:UDPglucose 6-dehydrogenase
MEGMNLFPEKSDDKYDCLSGADALVVVTEWREFTNPDYDKVKSLLVEPTIFDARNLFRTEEVLEKGFTYFAVGKKI